MRLPIVAAHLFACALLALAPTACQDDPAPFEPAACGLAPYAWLAADQVGQVVSIEEDVNLRMSASALEALLELAGQNPLGSLDYGARLFFVRYRTQDKGVPVEATGMLAIPWNEGEPITPLPLVLWLHGTTGFVGACSPSARARAGEADALALMLVAAKGFVVLGPDYIGLDADADPAQLPPVTHAYLAMEQVALGSWDMARATHALLAGELEGQAETNGQVVLWGGSQGGHAVLACDRYAPLYAPEFSVSAAIALVPGSDLLALADYALSSTNDASVAVAAALSTQLMWYEGSAPLSDLLTDEPPWNFASEFLDALYGGCSAGDRFEGVSEIEQVYQADAIAAFAAADWDELEPWSCYLRENSPSWTSLPAHTDTPLLMVTAELDGLAHTPTMREDIVRLCEAGHSIDYIECAEAGHVDAAWWALPEQLEWLEERLAGVPMDPATTCQIGAPVHCSAQPES